MKKPRPLRTTRRLVQLAFLSLTVGAVFFLGANAELWCPFGGVEAFYSYFWDGTMLCSLGVSNFFILGAILALTLLARRAFCGYMCPIGTISELLQSGAQRVGIKPLQVSQGTDRVLSFLKYPVLGVTIYFSWLTAELIFRAYDPCYVLISRHGKDITYWAYVVAGAIVLGSLFVKVPFCRWLCPMAAVLNPLSRFGYLRIRRHGDVCIDCGICNRACLMNIPVAQMSEVTSARCYGCMDCVEACPPNAEGGLSLGPPSKKAAAWSQPVLIAALVLFTSSAVVAAYVWPLASFVKEREGTITTTGQVELNVSGVTCRGSSSALWAYVAREDEFALPGYVKLEAWPSQGFARTRITYDADQVSEEQIKLAITSPYYNAEEALWLVPPYEVEGYDPYGLNELED